MASSLRSTANTSKTPPQVLRRWMLRNAELHAELIHLGYQDRNHIFTPRQVKVIVDYLGEP
ncbi:MAG: DUF4248 domain-containing protein [Bacteroides cellulosilyticus]